MTDSIIKAIRADWQVTTEKSIDCYQFPSGEKRIGITGASVAIGKAKNYLGRLHKGQSKGVKVLTGIGYTGYITECQVDLDRGATRANTISTRDFVKLITWDAISNKNPDSIILLAVFAETGLDDILDRLFDGNSLEFLAEKIVHYSQWTNEDLQMALLANYDDWKLIEEQELFLALN